MNLLAFPFYARLNGQDRFRRSCSGSGVFGQLTQPNRFPPFQIRRDKTGALLDCVHVYNLDGSLFQTLLHPALPYALHQTQFDDYITYYGALVTGLAMPCGFFYLEVGGLFSEVFQVASDLTNAVSVAWNNSKPLGGVRYGEGFTQILLLDTEILEPDYRFEEEGDLNGDEQFVRDVAKLSKLRVLESGGIPEYLVDAINAIPLHDDVRVGPFEELGKLTAKTAWLKGACRGNVSVTFEDERPVLWRECDDVEDVTEVDQVGFIPDVAACNGGPSIRPNWSDTGNTRCKTVEYWKSAEIVEQVSKNNCLLGGLTQTTQPVTFRMSEGRFESLASQQDADDQARSLFDQQKQPFANQNGVCVGDYVFLGGGPDGLNYFLNAFRVGNTVGALTVNVEIVPNGRAAVQRSVVIPAGQSGFAGPIAVDGQPYSGVTLRVVSTNPASYAFAL